MDLDPSLSSYDAPATEILDLGFLGRVEVDAQAAEAARNLYSELDSSLPASVQSLFDSALPQESLLAVLPYPMAALAGPPAGQGLEIQPAGWDEASVRTAGGFVVVAQGYSLWSIYSPGQLASDTPFTRVGYGLTVAENDGNLWSFADQSDFVLSDGTRLFCQTGSALDVAVALALMLVNGRDRVEISSLETASPQVSEVKNDGYEWRAAHDAEGLDSYYLGGSAESAAWFKEQDGQLLGEVVGVPSPPEPLAMAGPELASAAEVALPSETAPTSVAELLSQLQGLGDGPVVVTVNDMPLVVVLAPATADFEVAREAPAAAAGTASSAPVEDAVPAISAQSLPEVAPATPRYQQVIDRGSTYWVDPGLRPELGSAAWGNYLRSQVIDLADDLELGAEASQNLAGLLSAGHDAAVYNQDLLELYSEHYELFLQYGFSEVEEVDTRVKILDPEDRAADKKHAKASGLALHLTTLR